MYQYLDREDVEQQLALFLEKRRDKLGGPGAFRG